MPVIKIIKHAQSAPGLRLFGLGPNLYPCQGIRQLHNLLNINTSWAQNRSHENIKQMLNQSTVVVSLWNDKKIIGFGRATSDSIYRAILWDIVIDSKFRGNNYGQLIINKLVNSNDLINVEKIYIMTTNHKKFYNQNGFLDEKQQFLLCKHKNTK